MGETAAAPAAVSAGAGAATAGGPAGAGAGAAGDAAASAAAGAGSARGFWRRPSRRPSRSPSLRLRVGSGSPAACKHAMIRPRRNREDHMRFKAAWQILVTAGSQQATQHAVRHAAEYLCWLACQACPLCMCLQVYSRLPAADRDGVRCGMPHEMSVCQITQLKDLAHRTTQHSLQTSLAVLAAWRSIARRVAQAFKSQVQLCLP